MGSDYQELKMALAAGLAEELKKEVAPLIEEVRRFTEAVVAAEASRRLHRLLFREILCELWNGRKNSAEAFQQLRRRVLNELSLGLDTTKPKGPEILEQAIEFLASIEPTFKKPTDNSVEEGWPDELNL